MSSIPAKFQFDLDLSGSQRQTQVMTEARLAQLREEARVEGFAEGLAEGERVETARAAAALADAGQKIAEDATALLRTIDAADRQARTEATTLARAVGLKLAANLVSQKPEAEIEPLIEECLHSLERAPHLVVRCHPDLTDKLRDITEQHMAAAGFSGRLIVLGDPEIAPGDGRLEWAEGGLVRNMSTILAEIDKTIIAFCVSSGLPAPEFEPSPITETDHGRE
jgi:flagellar assembly protein FliH